MSCRRHLIALTAVLVSVGGCGGGHSSTGASATMITTTATGPRSTQTSAPASPSSARTHGVPSPGPPAGGPVPAGFDPVSFTAISAKEFWMLGNAPCPRPICTSIVRTTDGGVHFVGIPAPVAGVTVRGSGEGVESLRFADPLDGFAGDEGMPGPLWITHDGGAHWRRGLADVITFTVSGGRVYALSGACRNGVCSDAQLRVSLAGADRWTATPVPLRSFTGVPAMTAHGKAMWLSVTPTSGTPRSQVLVRSSDGGRTLNTTASPCEPGLGGQLEAPSAEVVWAVCPTGMLAGAWRSADGGLHWISLPAGGGSGQMLSNAARLAAVDDTTALIAPGGGGRLLRTIDSGRTFTPITAAGSDLTWLWLGFTDPRTGSALRIPAAAGMRVELWRSADAGASWHGPVRLG